MLLTPSGTHPCSGRAGGSDVLNHDGGHLNPEAGGGLIYLGTLGFPSSSQRDCQEQTRFVTSAALRPRGWAQASWQHLVAAPANPPNSKRVSFPLLMPSCSEGQPSPAGTAFPPGAAAGSIANAEKGGPQPQRGLVCPSVFPRKRAASFFGAIAILPPSTQSFWNRKASAHRCASPKGPGAGGTFALCHPQRGRSQHWTGAGWCPGPPRSSPIPDLARKDAGQCH